MSARDELRVRHERCPDCISTRFVLGRVGCKLEIPRDRALAIDCDRCRSFSQVHGKKPDFVILYESVTLRWIVLEMESNIYSGSSVLAQVEAGIGSVSTDEGFRFPSCPKSMEGLVLHSRSVYSDQVQVIARGVKLGRTLIPVRVHKAGGRGVRLYEDGAELRVQRRK
jgi:hypothetical protein